MRMSIGIQLERYQKIRNAMSASKTSVKREKATKNSNIYCSSKGEEWKVVSPTVDLSEWILVCSRRLFPTNRFKKKLLIGIKKNR